MAGENPPAEMTPSAGGSPSGLQEQLRSLLAEVCRLGDWPFAQAFVVDQAGACHPCGAWYGTDPRYAAFEASTARAVLSSGVGLPGRVIGSGRVSWITGLSEDQNFPRSAAAATAGFRDAIAFPILRGNLVVGVVECLSDRRIAPSTDVVDRVSAALHPLAAVAGDLMPSGFTGASDDRLRQILDTAADAFIGMDTTGVITEWNHASEVTFGWSRDEAVGRTVADLIVPEEYREAHDAGLARFLATGEARVLGQRLELSGVRRDGIEFPIELTLWALHEATGWSFYAFARDITARKQAEADLAHDALHDALTGLANRTALVTRITQALARMARGSAGPALLFVDLDRFKSINDSFGHQAGDVVLTTVAQRLTGLVRPTDIVARLAGDEFVVLLEDAASARDATVVASRIVDVLREPVPCGDRSLPVSASVGVALARPDSSPESLLRDADAAMYHAKQAGRGRFDIFGDQLRDRVTGRLQREAELATALERGEFELHYQPVVSLPDQAVTGVEALVRWQHPTHGLLLPAEFIDIAEESGQIVRIGSWVLAQACRQLHDWREAIPHGSRLTVAVNLSARQLAQPDLADQITRTLAEAALPFTDLQLGLEITESVLMHDPVNAAATLRRLRDLGIAIAIDDFGTGYSSLAYLKWFPVDTVKIDRSFVQTITTNSTDRAIVAAIINLTRDLGMSVVAEGIETTEQLDLLTDLGCTHAQGFLLGRPRPAAALGDVLGSTDLVQAAIEGTSRGI